LRKKNPTTPNNLKTKTKTKTNPVMSIANRHETIGIYDHVTIASGWVGPQVGVFNSTDNICQLITATLDMTQVDVGLLLEIAQRDLDELGKYGTNPCC
jgi:hypothetical protein